MFCCWSSIGKNKKSISSTSKEEVVSDLPEDVVVKILLLLPVKSLLRFTCVSKRWHSIISDSQFARSAFEVASQTRTLRSRLLFSTYPYREYMNFRFQFKPSIFQCLGYSDVSCLEEDPLVQSLIPPPGIITERVMASCNGLIVLAESRCTTYTNLCVWNPTTGFFRKIPDPEVSWQNGKNKGVVRAIFAFGHVMATDDYKFVFFVPADSEVHIFSTRDGSWKVIRFPHSSFPRFGDGNKGLLVSNGAIHWVSTGIPEAISAFDLVREEFCQLPLPRSLLESILHEDGRDPKRIWTQVLVGGRLCVRSRNEYWVMKQYGVPESWVKMFQFSVADLPNVFGSVYGWVPAFVTEGGTVVMRHGMELVRIECHREGEPVCSGRYKVTSVPDGEFNSGVTVYDETLLSV